jgi:phosphoribosylglycinamide formyltransferase-1
VENRPVPKIAVLISGRGSNLRAIVSAVRAGELHADVTLVLSNRADAAGLDYARREGLTTAVIKHGDFPSRQAYDSALVEELRRHDVSLVCLAGFMRQLGAGFCEAFPNAVLNIHPSLLPSFPGLHAQRQALQHGVTLSGATVHFGWPELDAGPILMQAAVPVLPDDTEESLSDRILREEHRLYPRAIQFVLDGGWRIEGRRVVTSAPGALR